MRYQVTVQTTRVMDIDAIDEQDAKGYALRFGGTASNDSITKVIECKEVLNKYKVTVQRKPSPIGTVIVNAQTEELARTQVARLYGDNDYSLSVERIN